MSVKKRFVDAIKHGKAPDIAISFKKKPDVGRWPDEHSYRVTGYIKMVDPETLKTKAHKDDWISGLLIDTAHKRDGKLLMRCTREEATHVSGTGVAGCIVAIEDIICGDYVNWDKETIDDARKSALRNVGEYID